jgi:hypothetical protein
MSPNVTIEENWEPEPELKDMPPRRIQPTGEPDLNLPSVPFWVGLGLLLIVVGIVLFTISHGRSLITVPGILLFLTGVGCAILGPANASRHKQRCEHLVTNGVPRMVRIITSENLAGSPYKRSVTYQYIDMNGDVKHKSVNVDDRLLPKRIPSNVTAVIDINTGDIELYCALPHRAVSKTVVATPVAIPTAPVTAPTATTPKTVALPNTAPAATVPTATTEPAPAKTAPVKTAGAKTAEENMAALANTPVPETKPKTTRKTAKKDGDEKKEEVYE